MVEDKDKMKKIFKNKKILTGLIALMLCIVIYMLIPKHNVFVKGPSMNYSRVGHTATLLNDGRVLIIGGKETQGKNTGHGLNIAEMYNPKSNKFELAGKLNMTREGHKAILLKSGDVFIYGGQSGQDIVGYPEKYNHLNSKFELISKGNPKIWHTLTLINNNVLILGGKTWDLKGKSYHHYNEYISNISEIYDPINNIEILEKMNKRRNGHTATVLNNGTVLITGGDKEGTAEIYNPHTNEFKLIGKLNKIRYGQSAYLLKNGNVILIGGDNDNTVEIYNPKKNKFELAGSLIEKRRSGYATALLDNDTVLIIGGTKPLTWGYTDLKSSEIYDPIEQKTIKGPSMRNVRANPTATTLLNGNILVCGGTDVYYIHKKNCELYKK